MSSKGFIILAQNSEGIDYIRQAYALALSIKLSQPVYNSVSLITDSKVDEKYADVFDHILDIPFTDEATSSSWKVENRWKFIYASPYDETIVLDSDMLFFKDITTVWDKLANHDVFFANQVVDFKGRIITDITSRKTFISNNLPNVYFALHYFKKTAPAFEFYKALEFVVHNWERCYTEVAPVDYQNWLSMDVSASIAVKILSIEEQVTNKALKFNFTHMKPTLQGWQPSPSSWVDFADTLYTPNGKLYINQFHQTGIVHYVEDEFLSPNILSILENQNDR